MEGQRPRAPPPPPGALMREGSKVIAEGASFEEIKAMAEKGRHDILTNGLSRSMSQALRRGESLAEKKSAWAFDFYQCTALYPVDYKYWGRNLQTDCGPTQLVTMHAHAYTSEGEEFAADQVYHRAAMKGAHKQAMQRFLEREQGTGEFLREFSTKRDKWGQLQAQLLQGKGTGRRT